MTVAGDRLTVDFTGSDTRQNLKAYSSFGNTRGYVVAQLASMMDPSIPKNEGFFQSIELIVPKGCVLNPEVGKTVAAGTHHPGVEVGEAICKALAQILPERSCPQIYKLGMPTVIFGEHPETKQLFVDHSVDVLAAYCNAVHGQDGWGSMPASFGNLIRATAEVNESIFPVRHEWCDYETDTGGAGEFRGCPGSRVVKRVLVPSAVTTYMVGMKYPMSGVAGGMDGSPNELITNVDTERAQKVECMANGVPHPAGEAFRYVYGGGGGWGDPLARDPEKVLDDVLDELVSLEAARRDYGVVLTGSLEALDLAVDDERDPAPAGGAALAVGHRIGIDVGGTFTDFVLGRDGREVVLYKVPTTLPDQSLGVMNGIAALAQAEGASVRALLAQTDLIVHGTTTADNTMIEMNGAVTGLITTAGHRDEIEIRRGYKESIWDPAYPPPIPIAPRRRRDRRARAARLPRQGGDAARRGGRAPRGAAPAPAGRRVDRRLPALLVHRSDPREARARDHREEHPGARVSLSHEVMPTAPEFERTSTTLVDAYVGPRVESYLKRLAGRAARGRATDAIC